MKRILWLLTGGTFSCVPSDSGLAPASSDTQAREILLCMPYLTEKYDIVPKVLMNIDSTDMTPERLRTIAETADGSVGSYDGIVITHGTDSMAYTAAALSVMLSSVPVPIVLTGSQRPFFAENSDARRNFADAIAVATDSRFRCVSVIFNGRIFLGSDCTKTDSVCLDAFSAKAKQLGAVDNEVPRLISPEILPCGKYTFDASLCKYGDKIAVLPVHPYLDASIIPLLISSGIRGFVIICYGAGGIPCKIIEELGKAVYKGVVAIAVSQCLHGGVDMGIYAVGTKAQKAGIISGGNMTVEYAAAVLADMLAHKRAEVENSTDNGLHNA